jgi:hypothetical protein
VHPWHGIPTTQGGKACGAYQFLGTTWARVATQLGFGDDFSPAAQDAGAIADIAWHEGAGEAIIEGDIAKAMRLLEREWVSLQSMSPGRAQKVFTEFGGVLAGAPTPEVAAPEVPAPIPAPKPAQEPVMPLLLSLLPMVLQLFAPKAQQALTKATDNPTGAEQLIQMLIGKAADLTGIPASQPVQVVAALQKAQAETNTPGAVAPTIQQLQDAALDWLDKIGPVIDKLAVYDQQAWAAEESSRQAAALRNSQMAQEGAFKNPAFIISLVILAMVGFVVGSVLWKDAIMYAFGATAGMGFSSDMQSFTIGAIVGGALTAIVSYFLGSSRSSSAKDALIGEMAARRPQQP